MNQRRLELEQGLFFPQTKFVLFFVDKGNFRKFLVSFRVNLMNFFSNFGKITQIFEIMNSFMEKF
jgi:hypothetical protein